MSIRFAGIHHVTAIAEDPPADGYTAALADTLT